MNMKINNLSDLLHHEMKDLWSAEKQLTAALPKLIDAASHDELRNALEDHLEITKAQQRRIEEICDEQGWNPQGHKCEGMEGIIKEGAGLLKNEMPADVLDAGIIGAAQRVEHYEMAGYGTARTHARQLGMDEAARQLQETLDEESEANELLTELAEQRVNVEATA